MATAASSCFRRSQRRPGGAEGVLGTIPRYPLLPHRRRQPDQSRRLPGGTQRDVRRRHLDAAQGRGRPRRLGPGRAPQPRSPGALRRAPQTLRLPAWACPASAGFLCRPDYPGHGTANVIGVIRRCAGVPADSRRAGSAGRVRPWHARGRRPPPSIASIVLRRRSGWPRTRGPPGAPPGSRRRARCRWCSDTVAAIRYEVLPGGWRTLPRVRAGRIRQASQALTAAAGKVPVAGEGNAGFFVAFVDDQVVAIEQRQLGAAEGGMSCTGASGWRGG